MGAAMGMPSLGAAGTASGSLAPEDLCPGTAGLVQGPATRAGAACHGLQKRMGRKALETEAGCEARGAVQGAGEEVRARTRGSMGPVPTMGLGRLVRPVGQLLPRAASSERGLCLATPARPPWSHRPPVPCPRPTLAVLSYPLIYACCISPVGLLYTGSPAPLPQAIGRGWLDNAWRLSPARRGWPCLPAPAAGIKLSPHPAGSPGGASPARPRARSPQTRAPRAPQRAG